jgi:IS5 family transposase
VAGCQRWQRSLTERPGVGWLSSATSRAASTCRGYGYAAVEADLHDLGVRYVAIPRASRPGANRRAFEHRKAFRARIKWRTGCEGRINHLKRSYGWNRTELTTLAGARTWSVSVTLGTYFYYSDDDIARSIQFHRDITDAITYRNRRVAESLMAAHIGVGHIAFVAGRFGDHNEKD